MHQSPKKDLFGPSFIIASIAASIFLCISILRLGNIQFGGMDGGVLTNVAWQLHLGYKPYINIVTAVPPILLILCKYSFDIFGVSWNSFVIITAIISCITFFWQLLLFRRCGFDRITSVLLVFTIQSITLLTTSWIWYNQLSAIIASLFASSTLILLKGHDDISDQASFFLASTLLLLSKPNVAAPLMIFSFIALTIERKALKRSLYLFALSSAFAIICLYLIKADPFILLKSYLIASGRTLAFENMRWFFISNDSYESIKTLQLAAISTLFSLISFILLIRSRFAFNRGFIFLATCCFISGFLSMATNNDFNLTDAPLILIGTACFLSAYRMLDLNNALKKSLTYIFLVILILFSVLGNDIAFKRLRIYAIGPNAFYEKEQLKSPLQPPFFKGTLVGPNLMIVLDNISSFVNSNGINKSAAPAVFFGPRIDFAYAAYGIKPYPGLPLWWEAFSDGNAEQSSMMIKRFIKADFKYIILLTGLEVKGGADFTSAPILLRYYIESHYKTSNIGLLAVYTKINK